MVCPTGKASRNWQPARSRDGLPIIRATFRQPDCRPCPDRSRCTRSEANARNVTFLPRRQEAQQRIRAEQATGGWRQRYALRCGVESLVSQASRLSDLHQARYRGLAKTHLQHTLTALAINLVRVDAWLTGVARTGSWTSRLARLTQPSQQPEFASRVGTRGGSPNWLAKYPDRHMPADSTSEPSALHKALEGFTAFASAASLTDEGKWIAELLAMADLATPMAVRVAATLRIADHITRGPRTAPELAETVNADADALDRVLRHLVTAGVLRRDASGRYALTGRGDALRDDHPIGIRAVLDIESAIGRAELSFVQLLHTVRTGEPAFPVQFGRSFWQDLKSDPARSASFDAQMGYDIAADAPAIVSAYDWGSLGHVVDVGGGNGALLTTMLSKYPTLQGTVVDLPDTAEAARKAFAAVGFADRADVVACNFFEALPPGAGGYLLSAILHDWDDDAARTILRRCAEAAGTDGKVFVVEKIGADGWSVHTGMDLRMLVYFGGRERDVAELTALAADSGLRVAAVHPADTLAIVELTAL